MKVARRAGSTNNILQIFIADSSSTTGAGLTGLTNASAGLTAYYHRDIDTTATAISLVTMTVGTFTSSGFKEIDASNMAGWYQFCPPDAALATTAKSTAIHLKGATNMAPLPIEIDLDAQVDVYFWNGTAVSSPATAGIPDVNVKNINNVVAATPGASGGILISGSNSGTTTLGAMTITGATTMTGGLVVNAGATITGSATGVGLTISGGGTSGAGLVVNTTSGDAVQFTPTAGHGVNIAANGTSKHGFFSTGGTAGTSDGVKAVAGTGGVDIRGNITGNITGNLSGAAGSLTTNNDKTGYALTSPYDFAKGTVAPTESYAALNAVPTPIQSLLEIRALLAENNVSGTTVTTKKLDGSTTAHTYTINSSSAPTAITTAS